MAKNEFVIEATIKAESAVKEFNDILSQGVASLEKLQDKAAALAGKKITFTPAIRYEVDADGLQKPVAYLKEQGNILKDIYQLQERLNKVQTGSVTNLRQSLNYAKQQRDELVRLTVKADEYGKKVKSVNPAWAEANNRVQSLARQLEIASASNFWQKIKAELNLGPVVAAGNAVNGLVNTFQSLSIVIAQIQAPIRAFSQALNDIQQIDLTFKGIGGGPADVAKVFADSSAIALKYGVNLKTVREGFQQLTPVILASGGSLSNVSEIIAALSSRFVTFGMSAEKSKRVMNGVIQAFGKGKLMAEELTQQISEADPAFKTDLANAINVTVAELNEMVKVGEVTSQKMLEWLPLLAKNSQMFGKLGTSATSAVAALGKGNATIEQVQNQLATLTQLNLESLAQLFKPLLGAFLQVQAATVDFLTQWRQLEGTKFVIDLINDIAQQLAGLYTVFLQAANIIGKFVDPIFFVINAINQLKIPFTEMGVVTGLLAAVITGKLVVALYSLASSTIPVVLTSVGALIASFASATQAMAVNFVAATGAAITSVVSYVAKAAVGAIANNTLSASYDRVTAAIARKTAAQAAESSSGAVQLALDLGQANSRLASTAGEAAKSTGGLKDMIGVTGPQFAAIAAVVAVAALALEDWKQWTGAASDVASKLKGDLEQLDTKYAGTGKSALNAKQDTEQFYEELERISKLTRQRNAFEIVIDYVFNSDMDSEIALMNVTKQLNQEFSKLKLKGDSLRNSILSYSSAQDQSGAAGERLIQSINKQVESYDALIQRAIEAREKQKAVAQNTGAGIDVNEKRQLEALQRGIDEYRRKRDELIKESQSKGLEINAKITTQGGEEAISTVAGLKEELKKLQEKETTLKVGSQGIEEVQAQIRGLQGFVQYLESDTYVVKIKAQFDLDKASLEGSLGVAQALFDNVKARAGLEESVFGIYQARDNYAIESENKQYKAVEKRLQKELDVLKEAGAGKDVIKAKEDEINKVREDGEARVESMREAARQTEIAAAKTRFANLDSQFKQEQKVLDLKHAQQLAEADMAILTAKNNVLEAEKAKIIALQNKAKAEQTFWTQEDDKAAGQLLQKSDEYLANTQKSVQAATGLKNSLVQSQAIERDTLNIQQQTTRNTEAAKLEQLGIGTSISNNTQGQGTFNRTLGEASGIANNVSNSVAGIGGATSEATGAAQGLASGWSGVGANLQRGISSTKVAVDEFGNLYTVLSQDPTDPLARGLTEVAGELYNIERGSADAKNELADLSNGFMSASGNLALIPGGFIAAGREGLQEWENAVARTAGYVGNVAAQLPLTASYTAETDSSVAAVRRAIEQSGSRDPVKVMGQLELEGQGMASSSVYSVVDAYTKYGYAVDGVRQTTDQLSQAQLQYNQAVASGDPGSILTAAGYVQQTREALGAANYELTTAAQGFQQASAYANELGLDVSNIPAQIYGISEETRGLLEQTGAYKQSVQEIPAALEGARTGVQGLNDETAAVGETVGQVGGQVDGLNDNIAGVQDSFGAANQEAEGLYSTTGAIVDEISTADTEALSDAFASVNDSAGGIVGTGFSDAAVTASDAGGEFDTSLTNAAGQAQSIYDTLSNIDSLNPTVEVNVVGTPGLFTGGPTDPGQLYRVNELGKEAFLSASGRLSMINKPKNGLWRAPSRGTVIPAHLTSRLDIPSGGVNLASGASARVSRAASGVSGSANMARALAQALKASGLLETNNNVAVSQAGQATQLGKLTHAVNRLVDKNWDVHVNVKNPSASTYMDLVNRMS